MQLYYLSKIYNVKKLLDLLNNSNLQHQKDHVLQILLNDTDDEDTLSQKVKCEEAISQNLANYIIDERLKDLPIPVLHRILKKSENLDQDKIESFLIGCLTKIGFEASVLFDTIDMEKVSSGFIGRLFNEFPDRFDFHYINSLFTKSLYVQQSEQIKQLETMKAEIESLKILLSKKEEEINEMKNTMYIYYVGAKSHAFLGIIQYLTAMCGGNVHDNGIVIVTSSSTYNQNYVNTERFVVDYNEQTRVFISKNGDNEWLKFDFKERKVRPTHYSIKSRHDYNGYHPVSWVIEGSNTGQNDWKELDKRENVECLKGINFQHTFNIQNRLEANDAFRYLRIRIITDSNGDKYLAISSLEFFGYLFNPSMF